MSVAQNSAINSEAAPAVLPDRSRRAALLCGCIVAFAYSANYTNHAPLALPLMREFGFNQALAGFLTTGIFATHAGMQIPGGHLVDRLGAKRVLLCALGWVALGNLGMALAGAYWQLLAYKIFTGIGTGVCFVGGARYVHAAAAGPRLNFAQGLFGGSVQLGAGFVILVVPRLYLLAGWRATFLVSAGMALTAGIIWLAAAPNVRSGAAPPGRFRGMLLAPQLWLLGLVQMASFGLSVVVGSWVVVILTKVLGVPATQAGLIGSLVLLLGIVSRPLGGIVRRHIGIRPLFIGSLVMIALGCFTFVSSRISLGMAVAAVVLIGMGVGLPYAAMFSRAGALFAGRAGAAMGLVNMLGIFMILGGAPLVGHLADLSGTFRVSFIVLGGFSLLVCAAVPFIHSDEPALQAEMSSAANRRAR
jgi:MFS family permease